MGMLNFAPVDKAFLLGSNQIKSTQEEIENLKKLLSNSVSINKSEKMDKPEEPDKPKITERVFIANAVGGAKYRKLTLPLWLRETARRHVPY